MTTLSFSIQAQQKLLIENPLNNKVIFYRKDTFILISYQSMINSNIKFAQLRFYKKETTRLDSVNSMQQKVLFFSQKQIDEYKTKCKDASVVLKNTEGKYNIEHEINKDLKEQLKTKRKVILYGGIGGAILIVGILLFK